jgi:uncharacterized protein YeaC (DUF1315 family)
VLKLPQKLLIYQQPEGIGFEDVHPDTWHNAPQKIDLDKWLQGREIKNEAGKYVLEAVVDAQNRQRENEEYRPNDTDEFFFEIKQ